jgi:hypothetical protein
MRVYLALLLALALTTIAACDSGQPTASDGKKEQAGGPTSNLLQPIYGPTTLGQGCLGRYTYTPQIPHPYPISGGHFNVTGTGVDWYGELTEHQDYYVLTVRGGIAGSFNVYYQDGSNNNIASHTGTTIGGTACE